MKTPVEIFEDWLHQCAKQGSDIGSRFHPIPTDIVAPFNDQIRSFKSRIAQIRAMMLPGREMEIYTDFTDKGWCNAAADVSHGLGVIAIAKGAVMLPLEMFNRMLSHPLVLQRFGNASLERIGPQHREGLPDDYDELVADRRKAGRSPLWRSPICRDRQLIVTLLFDLVQRFIAVHETTHIVFGHVEYLKSVGHAACLLEIQSHKLSAKNLDRQTIELSADDAAAFVIMNQFVNNPSRLVPGARMPDGRTRLFLWSFAIYSLFRLWDFAIDPTDLDQDHPPALLRFLTLMSATCHGTAKFTPEIGDAYLPIVVAARNEAEKAIGFCGADRIVPDDLIGAMDERVNEHMDRLYAHHDDVLIPECQKRAHIKLTERSTSKHVAILPPQPQTQP